jgi:hypothetical protein
MSTFDKFKLADRALGSYRQLSPEIVMMVPRNTISKI